MKILMKKIINNQYIIKIYNDDKRKEIAILDYLKKFKNLRKLTINNDSLSFNEDHITILFTNNKKLEIIKGIKATKILSIYSGCKLINRIDVNDLIIKKFSDKCNVLMNITCLQYIHENIDRFPLSLKANNIYPYATNIKEIYKLIEYNINGFINI